MQLKLFYVTQNSLFAKDPKIALDHFQNIVVQELGDYSPSYDYFKVLEACAFEVSTLKHDHAF